MIISVIVAASKNGVIGSEGQIPWHLSSDLKRFRKLTLGKPVIMGRLTFESIGKPLPGRRNIVITSNNKEIQGAEVVSSPEEALELCAAEPEVSVIGGGQIYKRLLSEADKVYLTEVDTEIEGDTYFDFFNREDFSLSNEESCEENGLRFRYLDFIKAG